MAPAVLGYGEHQQGGERAWLKMPLPGSGFRAQLSDEFHSVRLFPTAMPLPRDSSDCRGGMLLHASAPASLPFSRKNPPKHSQIPAILPFSLHTKCT